MHQIEVHVEGENIGALGSPFTIGRDPECDVILPDSSVSRRHLKVTITPSGLLVEDMGSSNGTWLNGRRITREVVPNGQAFVVGRVSMALRSLDEGARSTPYVPPAARANGNGQRHDTLAVDIPQGYFDPSPPPMRTFDCPGCGRKLRCAARTRRVKCRNCDEIIRFDGEVPTLERIATSPQPVAAPAPVRPPAAPVQVQPAPPVPVYVPAPAPDPAPEARRTAALPPEPRQRPSTPLPPAPAPMAVSSGSDAWVEQAKADAERRAHHVRHDELPMQSRAELYGSSANEPSILAALPSAPGGKAAIGMLLVGGGIAAVSMFIFIAGVSQMLPFIIIGCVLALGGFVYAAAAWTRSGSHGGGQRAGGGVEERLHRLNRLRAENLITEEEYGLRRREILRDL